MARGRTPAPSTQGAFADEVRTARAEAPARVPASSVSEATPSIDRLLDSLEQIVEELEGGDLSLERALARFEDGIRLARRGEELLAAVEERIERLLDDRGHVAPFFEADASSAEAESDDTP